MHPFHAHPTGLGMSAARLGRQTLERAPEKPPSNLPILRLQDINFGCPWPLRESPNLDQARAHALAWMEKFGLAGNPSANAELYRSWKLGERAAWLYPDGTAEGVALAAALIGWYFAPLDDLFDGELGKDMLQAAAMITELYSILLMPEGATPSAAHPVSLSFADLWRRSSKGMSSAWKERAAYHWKQYLGAQLAEVVNRVNKRSPDSATHLRQRTATTWSRVLGDLMEPVSGYELPAVAWHTPLLDELRQLTAEILSITNDLVSAAKEEAHGDIANNLLLIFENQQGYSRPEAIEKLRHLTHERTERFLRLEQHVPDLDGLLDLPGRASLRRYVQGLHDLVAGDNEWQHTSGRYRL